MGKAVSLILQPCKDSDNAEMMRFIFISCRVPKGKMGYRDYQENRACRDFRGWT